MPIVEKRNIIEIDERIDFSGDEVVRLNGEQVREAVRALRARGVQGIAICFLWSFVRPDHEQQAAAIVREEWPEGFLTLSSEIAPVMGEYERTATAVINSYLGPVISRYIGLLEERLQRDGFPRRLLRHGLGRWGHARAGDCGARGEHADLRAGRRRARPRRRWRSGWATRT